jgi:hypothetical protein
MEKKTSPEQASGDVKFIVLTLLMIVLGAG